MNAQEIMIRYCIDANEPTKSDADDFFKNQTALTKLSSSIDGKKLSPKAGKTKLDQAKKIYMNIARNSLKIKAMIERKMLGPYIDDYARLKRSIDGTYQFIVKCCNAAIAGKDSSEIF